MLCDEQCSYMMVVKKKGSDVTCDHIELRGKGLSA